MMADHLLTVVDEGNGFTPICSCGWAGPRYATEMGARIGYAMHHAAAQLGRHEHDWSEWSHPDALDPTREIRHCKCGAAENRHPQSGRQL